MRCCLIACLLSLVLLGFVNPARAEEMKWLELRIRDRVYTNAKLIRVEPDGIRIMHETGAAKIGFEDIPHGLRGFFTFDADKAVAYREARREAWNQAELQEREKLAEFAKKQLAWEEKLFTEARRKREGYIRPVGSLALVIQDLVSGSTRCDRRQDNSRDQYSFRYGQPFDRSHSHGCRDVAGHHNTGFRRDDSSRWCSR